MSQTYVMSLCIPRVFMNIRESRIRGVLNTLQLGEIGRIDFVRKEGKGNGKAAKPYNCVFIHFTSWNDGGDNADAVKAKLNTNEQVKIVYDDPWYWMIGKSKAKVPVRRAAPRIVLDGATTTKVLPQPELLRHDAVGPSPAPLALTRQPSGKAASIGEAINRED